MVIQCIRSSFCDFLSVLSQRYLNKAESIDHCPVPNGKEWVSGGQKLFSSAKTPFLGPGKFTNNGIPSMIAFNSSFFFFFFKLNRKNKVAAFNVYRRYSLLFFFFKPEGNFLWNFISRASLGKWCYHSLHAVRHRILVTSVSRHAQRAGQMNPDYLDENLQEEPSVDNTLITS